MIFIQTYVSEISDPDWRTTLCAGMGLMYIAGTLSIYTLGAICHWRLLAGLSAIFPALSFICGLFSPESPPWLITKGTEYKTRFLVLVTRFLGNLRVLIFLKVGYVKPKGPYVGSNQVAPFFVLKDLKDVMIEYVRTLKIVLTQKYRQF